MNEEIQDVPGFDALLIIAQRCYDLLSIIASSVDAEAFEAVLEIHKKGGFFGPEPSYRSLKED
jgi:hypothetical protein